MYSQALKNAIRQIVPDATDELIDSKEPKEILQLVLGHYGFGEWQDFLTFLFDQLRPENRYIAGQPMPENIGLRGDLYKEVQQVRYQLDKDVKVVKDRESELRESLIRDIDSSDTNGAVGRLYKTVIKEDRKPRIKDGGEEGESGWTDFYAYVKETGRFDLLQKRLSEKAIMDMHENGEMPPGLETMIVKSVSVTKI